MEIIQFKEANCKGCYKCIRNCEIKAIKFSNDQARILDNECIFCGKCTLVCPQNAKVINSDLSITKKLISNGYDVYVSLAPSYVAEFPDVSFSKISASIKKLGFKGVEETAIGATMVSKKYAELMKQHKMRNIITTCCPTVNLLVEKYYPELVPFLAPVVTPLTAHAKAIKNTYGENSKVVFIGPCISKKYEASLANNIDTVLMFNELRDWLEHESISFSDDDTDVSEMENTISRFYPVPSGIINTIPEDIRKNYKTFAVDGLDRCIEILDSLKSEETEGFFIEMNSCSGSCVKGPGMSQPLGSLLKSKDLVLKNVNRATATLPPETEKALPDMSKTFDLTLVKDKIPDENTITAILSSIGKYTEKDLLNCGACGYSTCREKAVAVFQGKADLKMCLPYMREKAESMSNIILENTPDAIFVTDKDFNVIEYNPSAKKMFRQIDENTMGLPVEMLINSEEFKNVRSNGENVYYAVCKDTTGELFLDISIINAPNRDYIILLKDVTLEKKRAAEIEELRRHTLETTQNVIDKQMRVAQEIASRLGETTGETKAALTKLKKSIAQSEVLKEGQS